MTTAPKAIMGVGHSPKKIQPKKAAQTINV